MKTICAMTAAVVAVLAAGAATARGWDDFTPQDPVVKQPGRVEWKWDGDDGIGLGAPLTLHYTPQGAPRIVATGSDDILAHLQEWRGELRMEPGWRNSGNARAEVTITGVTARNISLSGTGRLEFENVDLDRLHLAISGSGSAAGGGRADHLDLAMSGSGNADLSRLTVRDANIHLSGSGNVRVSPSGTVSLAASGSGVVRMTRQPARINQSVSGSGGVRIEGN
jgi:hypothetical protein